MAAARDDAPDHRALASTGKHHARSITAAATRFDLTKKADRQAVPRTPERWQEDAWAYYDLVGPIKYAGRFMGSALARIRLYPGIRLQADENPVSLRDLFTHQEAQLRDDPEADVPFPGLTMRHVEDAEDVLDSLANRRTGQSGLLRSWGTILTISGDSWLIGTDEKNLDGTPTGDVEWLVVSDRNLARKGEQAQVKLAPGARAEPIEEAATLIRVWRPHEAWPALPDSNMRAALDICEELLALARMFRSIAKSRNNAGLLLLPTELDFANPVPPASDDTPKDDLTPFERAIVKSLMTPVEDDGSASAVVPHVIRGAAAVLAEVRHVPLSRTTDDGLIARAKSLVLDLALCVDLPPEVLVGMADVNHWTAWQIEDSTYQAHVEPTAMLPAWALTSAYLRPTLKAGDASLWDTPLGQELVRRVEVGLDPSALVARPNRAQDAKDGHKALVISDQSLRKYLGMSDADAPSEDELMRRYALERGIGGQDITRELLRMLLDAPLRDVMTETATPPGEPADEAPADQDQPTPEEERPENEGVAGAVVAAAPRLQVGARLAAIDQRLRDRLQVAASAAVEEAVRVAGNRLRSAARTGPPEARAVVQPGGTPALQAAACGPALYAAGVLTEQDEETALEGAFAVLATQWDQWVAQAQDDTEAVLRSSAQVDDEALDATMAEYRQGQDEDRSAGWGILSVALLAIARDRIRGLSDTPEPEHEGEFDPTLAVQTGPVRQALARAGGSVEPSRPPATVAGRLQPGAAGGVATGPQALNTLPHLGLVTQGWEWHVGAPSRPFPPHSRLSGQVFTDWADPVLAYAGWPNLGHAFPGDHRGCQCDAEPVIVPVTDASLVL